MERYRIIKTIGDGTFGTVVQAEHIETGRLVAIKRMKKKYDSWEECLKLREVKLAHPNLIRLHEVVREHRELHFIFEHLQQNLYQCVRHRRMTRLSEARDILKQCLQGLGYMHDCGFVHRDIKPENILLSRVDVQSRNDGFVTHRWIVKLADLGLARPVPPPPEGPPLTQYVSTRWYRAPEVLLRCRDYELPIDVWAIGTVAAEICNGRPMFPGRGEPDQLARLAAVLGSPNDVGAPGGVWVKGVARARSMGLRFPKIQATGLQQTLLGFDPTLLDLIGRTLRWDPHRRITCAHALAHPFFLSTLDRPLIVTASSVDTSVSISSVVTLAAAPPQATVPKQSASAVELPMGRSHQKSNSRVSLDNVAPPMQRSRKSIDQPVVENHHPTGPVPPKRKRASLPPSVFHARQESFSNPTSPEPSYTPKSPEYKQQQHARTSETSGPIQRVSLAQEASLVVDNEITLDNEYTSPDMLPQLELSVGVDPSGSFKGRKMKKDDRSNTGMWSAFETLITRRSSKGEEDEEKTGLFRMLTRSRSRSRKGKVSRDKEDKAVVIDKLKSKSVPNVATASQPVLVPKTMPDDVPSENLEYWEQEADAKQKNKRSSALSLPRLFKRSQSRGKKPETTANVKLTDVQGASRNERRGRDPNPATAKNLASPKPTVEKKGFDLPRLVSLGKTLTRSKKQDKQPILANDSSTSAEMNDTLTSLKDFTTVSSVLVDQDDRKTRRATLNDVPISTTPVATRESRSKTVTDKDPSRRAKSVGVEVSRTFQNIARRLRTPKNDEDKQTWTWRSPSKTPSEVPKETVVKRRSFFGMGKKTPPHPEPSTSIPKLVRHSVDTSMPSNPLVYHPTKSTKSLSATVEEASWNGTNSSRSFYLHPTETLGTPTPHTASTSASAAEDDSGRLLQDKKAGIWV